MTADSGARADWQMITAVAQRMGFGAQFAYRCPADIFREHAALSAFENNGERDLDLGALATLSDADYDALAPTYWPCSAGAPATVEPHEIFASGRFFTPNRRARMVPIRSAGVARAACDRYPLLLNSGRLRDQWHTMTRTQRAARLNRHRPWPTVTVHPLDARQAGVSAGDIARMRSRHGHADLVVRCSRRVQPGTVFAPMHWSDQVASAARIDALFEGVPDPVSHQPELKSEPVALGPLGVHTHALWLCRSANETPRHAAAAKAAFWATAPFERCEAYAFGFVDDAFDRDAWLATLMPDATATLRRERDGEVAMVASVADDRLAAVVVLSARPNAAQVNWYAALFDENPLSADGKAALLRGAPGADVVVNSGGATLCACHGTEVDAVTAVVEDGLACNADTVGALTRAGTRCGSCIPEIEQIIEGG
ncbi:MAG: molybdopterin dinucleotide binding domain-containing protein [Pseudomonadota bacterium]